MTSSGGMCTATAAVRRAVAGILAVVVAPALLIFQCRSKDSRRTGRNAEGEGDLRIRPPVDPLLDVGRNAAYVLESAPLVCCSGLDDDCDELTRRLKAPHRRTGYSRDIGSANASTEHDASSQPSSVLRGKKDENIVPVAPPTRIMHPHIEKALSLIEEAHVLEEAA